MFTTLARSNHMQRLVPALALVAALALAGSASAAKVTTYKGKTKEGTAITVTVTKDGWAGINTTLPTSCVSAQGGPPEASIFPFNPSYEFRVGRKSKVKDESSYPTRNYHVETKLRGKKLIGKLSMNYSLVAYSDFGYRILTCMGNGSFELRARS
jgi:hypothetical protein